MFFASLRQIINYTKLRRYFFAAQVNEHMPRSFGDTVIHSSHFDWAVRYDCPLPCVACPPANDLEQEIGKIIAQRLVEDGATLQLGIGCIPEAVLCSLVYHKDLGIHSEVLSDAMVDLVEHGNITNKCKIKHKGRMIGSLAIGTKRLYDFVHNNPFVGNYRFITTAFGEKNALTLFYNYCHARIVSDQLRERSPSDRDATEDDGHKFLHRDGPHRTDLFG